MLNFREHPHPLLKTAERAIRGPELAQMVAEERTRFADSPRSSVTVLPASATLEFVATFLALLDLRKPVAVASRTWTEAERHSALALLAAPVHPQTAVILFTSGSTGQPRAVQLSRKNIFANMQAVITSLEFASAREQVLFLPLSYSFGLLGQLLPALHLGVCTTLIDSFALAPAHIAIHGMQGMWSGVPSHWITLLRALSAQTDLEIAPSHIISAGGRLDLEVRRQMRHQFPTARLFNNYGLTEASPRLLSLSGDNFLSDAVGFPVGDWEIHFTPEGELIARGPQTMLGYLGGTPDTERVRDGWLYTGDLGHLDDSGCVHLQGRADHLVKVAGERLSLAEIETALALIPGVHAACVLAKPHPFQGHMLEAFVELKEPVARADILKQLRGQLSTHKIPQAWFQIPALPLKENGKVDRQALLDPQVRLQTLE